MAVNWTEKQTAAIEKSGCNLIVGAAAGSGKTAVLVERIIRKIQNPASGIEKLLITTFTEAAASKMKADIKKAISDKLEEEPDNTYLSSQAILVSHADISTIHAFCLRVIRNNFQSLDIDPDFLICDESEAELLKQQATDEAFEYFYESGDDGFYSLLDAYSGQRGDTYLKDLVLKLLGFVKSMPFYEEWIKEAKDAYDNISDFENTPYYEIIIKNLLITAKRHISAFRIAAEEAAAEEFLYKYAEAFNTDIAMLEGIEYAVKNGTRKDIECALAGFSLTRASAKNGINDALKGYLSKIRDKAKEDFSYAYKTYFENFDIKIEKLSQSKIKVEALFNLMTEIDARFSELKIKRNLLDFNDIEHYCLKVLSCRDGNGDIIPSKAAENLKEKYEEILIDEYQDANEMQEMIFSLISRGNNIFMVGDLKQSIYRFRHTNPMLFKEKIDTYSNETGENQRVIMAENFRSRSQVIDCVNFIFEQISSPTVGEIIYDKTQRLNFAANYPENSGENYASELILVTPEDKNETEEDETEADGLVSFSAEANAICKHIKSLMKSGFEVYDKTEGMRPLRLKDIVILMRSPKKDAALFCEIMEQNRISCFADVGGGYFDSEEISVMKSLLSVIDNPRQDIALLAVLRCPIFEFSENELLKFRMADTKNNIYQALCTYASSGEDEALKEKCTFFKQMLGTWRKKAKYMPVYQLIYTLYQDTGYFAYVGAMPGGEMRRANLRLLAKRAENFEQTSYKGLFNFVSYIEKLAEKPKDSKGARLLGENQDVVRIMSIHKSKGLEFPVVFLAGINKSFNLSDLTESVLMHKKLGIGVNYVDSDLRYKAPLIIRNVIADVIKDELLSEELRLLYVALTRAREKLYMTGYVKNLKKRLEEWEQIASEAESISLPVYRMRDAKKYADWIVPALMRCPQGKVLSSGNIAPTGSNIDLKVTITTEHAEFDEIEFLSGDEKSTEDDVSEIAIKNTLSAKYKNPMGKYIAKKLSVTELKRIINTEIDSQSYIKPEESLVKMPEFLKDEKGITAAKRGSIIHYIMQKADLSKRPCSSDIENLIQRLSDEGFLTKEQIKYANIQKILTFFKSDLGVRMISSGAVFREIPFEINIDASFVYHEYTGDEKILLQGIIDCYFKEDSKIVLLDYKTDRVTDESCLESLVLKYTPQLKLYEMALEKMLEANEREKAEIEKYIYFFSCDKAVKVD